MTKVGRNAAAVTHGDEERALLEEINSWLPPAVDWKGGAIEYLGRVAREQGADAERYHVLKPFIGGPDFTPFCEDMARFVNMVKLVNLPMRSAVLDVGCGSGWTTHFLAKLGHRVLGIDISKDLLELATRRVGSDPYPAYAGIPFQVEFRVHDIEEVPVQFDEPFDLAVFDSTLHHFYDPIAVLKNVRRCLKPGGGIIILEAAAPDHTSDYHRRNLELMDRFRTLERPYTRSQLTRMLQLTGFPAYEFYYPVNGFFDQTAEQADAIREGILKAGNWNIVLAGADTRVLERARGDRSWRNREGGIEFFDGFYAPERSDTSIFRWSKPHGVLKLDGIVSLTLRIASFYPARYGKPQALHVFIDGALERSFTLTPEASAAIVALRSLTGKRQIDLCSDSVFSPSWDGDPDVRLLSFMVEVTPAA